MSNVTSITVTVTATVPTGQYENIILTLSETTILEESDVISQEENLAIRGVISALKRVIGMMDCPGATHWVRAISYKEE